MYIKAARAHSDGIQCQLRGGLYAPRRVHTMYGMIKFEWDAAKAESNQRKHGVSFEEAQSVFLDELAVQFFDVEASTTEDRFLLLGYSEQARLLIVCHCERQSGQSIRIISARKATKRESQHYQGR